MREQREQERRDLRDRERELRDAAAARRERLEKGAYLGVATTPAPPALRQQLGLPRGVGLVVEFIAPASPAEEAGLRQYDVIQKLDDQILVNPEQLAVLVRTHKAGDEIKLLVIRAGKSLTFAAKLIEKDVPPLEDLRLGMFEPGDNVLPGPAGRPVRLYPSAQPHPGQHPGEQGDRYSPGPPDENGAPRFQSRQGWPDGLLDQAVQVVWDDGDTEIAITSLGGAGRSQFLLARDKSGKILFEGPINTPDQRKGIPDEVRLKLVHLPPAFGFSPPPSAARQETPVTRPAGPGGDKGPDSK